MIMCSLLIVTPANCAYGRATRLGTRGAKAVVLVGQGRCRWGLMIEMLAANLLEGVLV
jgi:hypothetical protein